MRLEIDQKIEASQSQSYTQVLGLKWNSTDNCLEVCRYIDEEVETIITQTKTPSLISSNFDSIGLFAPLCVPIQLLLNCIHSGPRMGNVSTYRRDE